MFTEHLATFIKIEHTSNLVHFYKYVYDNDGDEDKSTGNKQPMTRGDLLKTLHCAVLKINQIRFTNRGILNNFPLVP